LMMLMISSDRMAIASPLWPWSAAAGAPGGAGPAR
jgi:hypothetical protein